MSGSKPENQSPHLALGMILGAAAGAMLGVFLRRSGVLIAGLVIGMSLGIIFDWWQKNHSEKMSRNRSR